MKPFDEIADFYRTQGLTSPRHALSTRFIKRTQRKRVFNLFSNPGATLRGAARRLGRGR
jgi:hypothetical protein